MKMKNLARVLSVSLTLAAVLVPAARTQTVLNPAEDGRAADAGYQRHLAEVARKYGAEGWLAGDRVAGLPLAELTFPGFEGESVYDLQSCLERRFEGIEGLPSFHVEAEVGASAKRSHAVLLEWLAGLSSLAAAPAAGDLGIAVGDQGYVGLSGGGPEAISWIAFVRGNVAVRVTAAEPGRTPQPDLPAIAAEIDRRIRAQETLAPDAVLPRPVIARFQAAASRCAAGEVLPLELQLLDAAGAPASYDWVVGGTGQGYVERRDDGFRLFTTGPGRIRLTVSVTGRLGARSDASSLEIEVEDD